MTKRFRMSISAGLLVLSITAVAAAASSSAPPSTSGPTALLTAALICVVLTLLVWSDELDRSSVRRSREARREGSGSKS